MYYMTPPPTEDEANLYARQSVQRGARMQIMRDYMKHSYDDGAFDSVWNQLLEAYPEAKHWFDKDGVPAK